MGQHQLCCYSNLGVKKWTMSVLTILLADPRCNLTHDLTIRKLVFAWSQRRGTLYAVGTYITSTSPLLYRNSFYNVIKMMSSASCRQLPDATLLRNCRQAVLLGVRWAHQPLTSMPADVLLNNISLWVRGRSVVVVFAAELGTLDEHIYPKIGK